MQVAVADVAVPDHVEARADCVGQFAHAAQEFRHLRNGDGQVVLVGGEMRDGFRNAFPVTPQLGDLPVALADHAVGEPALRGAALEASHGAVFLGFVRAVEFGDHVERAPGVQRRRQPVPGADVVQRAVGEELEGGKRQFGTQGREHPHQRPDVLDTQQHDLAGRRRVRQAQGGLHHQPERAFAADEQVAQIVAAGVLDQAPIAVQQLPPAGDHPESGDPVARQAVAQYADAAGVGRNVAADLAGAFRSE